MTDGGKGKFNFKRESLPLKVQPYQEAAVASTVDEFVGQVPYPFLLYQASKLWDPLLLMARANEDGGNQTALVSYNVESGGHIFISPLKKRQTDPGKPAIMLGRETGNDLVVPVSSISGIHAAFQPVPGGSDWTVIDLGTKNGTWLQEEQLAANAPVVVPDGSYLRLGGNLIAWFLLPKTLWEILRDPARYRQMTET